MQKKMNGLKKLTDTQLVRRKRDAAIYKELIELTADDQQSRTMVVEYLAQKYGVCYGTIYVIKNRMEKRLQAEAV